MKLSLIIINYNVKFYLEHCLISVFNSLHNFEVEVIVVDNHSTDGSKTYIPKRFPQIKYIYNTENLGFSKANNQALKIAKGEYCLLLNPDTMIANDTLSQCISFMDSNHEAGALGVKMLNGEGKFLPESKRGLPTPKSSFFKFSGLAMLFMKSPYFNNYQLGHLDNDLTHEVAVLAGAFLMIRTSVLKKIGLLDEAFFMYGEDIDLSYRITQAGYKNYYFPQTQIIHFKGESTKKSSINYVKMFYMAMLVFANKHFSKKNYKSLFFLINTAIYIKAFLAILLRFTSFISKSLSWMLFYLFRPNNTIHKRILYVGDAAGFPKIKNILIQSGIHAQLIENFSVNSEIMKYPNYLGAFTQLKDIVKIYKPKEIIFDTSEIILDDIVEKVDRLRSLKIKIKYYNPQSNAIVGSQETYSI